MNPPFGGRNGLVPWLNKFFKHGSGIALTPDRSATDWYHSCLVKCDAFLIIKGKVKFIRPDGSKGDSPTTGTTLWAIGSKAVDSLNHAESKGLGVVCKPNTL